VATKIFTSLNVGEDVREKTGTPEFGREKR